MKKLLLISTLAASSMSSFAANSTWVGQGVMFDAKDDKISEYKLNVSNIEAQPYLLRHQGISNRR